MSQLWSVPLETTDWVLMKVQGKMYWVLLLNCCIFKITVCPIEVMDFY